MVDRTPQDIKQLEESLRAFLEKSLATISQKQDSQFQKQDSQFQELNKKLTLLINSRTSPLSTAVSEPSAQLSSSAVDTNLKTAAEIPSTKDEDHEHYRPPNSTFIIEEETRSELPPSPPLTWKYDVFVSFRGKDTRKGFVSHLFQAFKREDINCYRDVDGNERGQEVDSMLLEAIHHSKMAIVLFSQNYADSKWCLKELDEILRWNKQNRIHGHMVLPIFYGVSADDVKHLGGMVGEAYVRCINNNGGDDKDIWKNAIKNAGRISSWTSNNGDEAHLIQEIVEVLLERVAYSRSSLLVKSSIVPNDNLRYLCSMLDTMSNDDVRTVGVCGTKGVGKTTLANAACVYLHKVFEGRVILLEDIHAIKSPKDVLEIHNKIAAKLLKDKLLLKDAKNNVLEIQTRLPKEKVLIVLDNVTTLEQVESVLGKNYEKYLGLGSRVVITSQDWELLDKLKVDDIYMVPPLNYEDSLKLFYHYAFMGQQEVNVNKGYEELSKNIIHYAGGLPSVLECVGHSLSNASETEWHKKLGDLVRSTSHGDTKLYQYGGGEGIKSRWDDGKYCDVRGIEFMIEDSVIKSIGVTYDNYGHPVGPFFHGNSSSSSTVLSQKIELDYPYEYLMAISGYIGKNEATKVTTVRSLTLHSNTRTFGPFGDESKTGRPFSTQPTGAKIVGFFGGGDCELQYIGVHVIQVGHTYPHHQDVGPFGDLSGNIWDHGVNTDIRKITIGLHRGELQYIICDYDKDGVPVEKKSLDGVKSKDKREVTLNYPSEYIVSMSGCYEQYRGKLHVKLLTFQSNLKTYGPYGSETELTFSTPLELGKIVGFYGNQSLKSMGAYFAPVYHERPLTFIKPFGDVFSDTWDDGKHSDVKRIDIHHGRGDIFYMRFRYVDGNGGTVRGRSLGSHNYSDRTGLKEEVIELDNSKEYLVSISGHVTCFKPPYAFSRVNSLSFETNLKRKLGPFGSTTIKRDEKPFSFKSSIAKIVGFHGTIDSKNVFDYSIGPHFQLL